MSLAMTHDDWRSVYLGGLGRYSGQRGAGNADGSYRPGLGIVNDLEGIAAEWAFSLLCGIAPRIEDFVLRIPLWERLRGPTGGELTDVLGCEIRATQHPEGRLFVHKDSSRDGEKKLDTTFVLAIVDMSYFYPDTSFRTGGAELDAQLLARDIPYYTGNIRFPGWCLGRDAKEKFTAMAHPEYHVRQEHLKPMSALAGKLGFVTSEEESLASLFEDAFTILKNCPTRFDRGWGPL